MRHHYRIAWLTVGLILQGLLVVRAPAHPGSAIAVDDKGTVWFTDTGKGVWRLAPGGGPELISTTAFHFMGLDPTGAFSKGRQNFGRWFARVTPEGAKPTVISCSDFPLAFGRDGNLYYANTMRPPARIIRRTPEGKESDLAVITEEAPPAGTAAPELYVTGITVAPDGSIYLVDAAAQSEHVFIRRVGMDGAVGVVARSFLPPELRPFARPAVAPSSVPAGIPVPLLSRTYCRGLCVGGDGTIYVAASGTHAVLEIRNGTNVRVVLLAEAPWSPTDVALFNGDLYVLEYDHTGEDRLFWTPRVRRVDARGKIETLVTITRD